MENAKKLERRRTIRSHLCTIFATGSFVLAIVGWALLALVYAGEIGPAKFEYVKIYGELGDVQLEKLPSCVGTGMGEIQKSVDTKTKKGN